MPSVNKGDYILVSGASGFVATYVFGSFVPRCR